VVKADGGRDPGRKAPASGNRGSQFLVINPQNPAFGFDEPQFLLVHDTVSYYTNLVIVNLSYARDFKKASASLRLLKKHMSPGDLLVMSGRLGIYPDPEGLIKMYEGNRELAEEHLRKQAEFFEKRIEDGDEGMFSAYNVAVCKAVLGRKDEAYHWLKTALSKNVFSPRELAVDPWLDNLREHAGLDHSPRRLRFSQPGDPDGNGPHSSPEG